VSASHDRKFFDTFMLVLGILLGITIALIILARIIADNTSVANRQEDPVYRQEIAARISPVAKVAVAGQGVLGQMADQMAKLGGAARVTAVASGSSKRAMAEKSGVDEFVALDGSKAPSAAVSADVVIDCTGSRRGFEGALEMAAPGGRVVMLSSIAAYAEPSDWARVVVEKGLEVRGAHVRNLEAEGLTYRDEAKRFLDLLEGRKICLEHLITDVCAPDNAPDIYRRLASGDRGMAGIVIDWQTV